MNTTQKLEKTFELFRPHIIGHITGMNLFIEALEEVSKMEAKSSINPVTYDYQVVSANNHDLYEYGKHGYNRLIELGKQGYKIMKVQEIHECGTWILLMKEISNEPKDDDILGTAIQVVGDDKITTIRKFLTDNT